MHNLYCYICILIRQKYNSWRYSCFLYSMQVDQLIHRILAEEDADNSREINDELFHASGDAGEKLYKKGDFAKSQLSNIDAYLLRKVRNDFYCILRGPHPSFFTPVSFKERVENSTSCRNKFLIFRLACFQMS